MRPVGIQTLFDSLSGNESSTAKAMRDGMLTAHLSLVSSGAELLAFIGEWWPEEDEGGLFFIYRYKGEYRLTRYYMSGKIFDETFPSKERARHIFITLAKWAYEDSRDPYWYWRSIPEWRKPA